LGNGQGDQHDIFYVAVVPPKTIDGDLLKRVASFVGKEIFDTRLLLFGDIPRILAPYPNTDTADSIAQSLRESGLVAFVCRDSELRNRSTGFVAHTATFGEREVLFWDRHGGEVRVEAGDAFLMMRGRIQGTTQEKTSTTKLKLNVPATVLTGGIPIMKRVTKKGAKEFYRDEDFVRIFDRKSSDPRVEMFQNHFDYTLLDPKLTPSTQENFNIVVTKLRELFPRAIFDERLTRHFKADIPASEPEEAIEINCRLIYLCHSAMERRGRL
jgi:hypothetical protein